MRAARSANDGTRDGAAAARAGSRVRQPILLLALVVTAVAVLAGSVDATRWVTADGLRAAVGADEWYGPLGYVSTIVGGMFLPVPKAVLLGLGGVLFGPWAGFAYAWIGQVLGMTAVFLLARTGLRDVAQRIVYQHVEHARRVDRLVDRGGVRVVALCRLFYFMGTPLTVMLATTRLRLAQFVAGTMIGVVPAVALAVASGDAVASGTTGVGAAVIGVAIVLVLGVGTVVRRRLGL